MAKFAIFRMDKMKESKHLSDSYKHNERLVDVENADPNKLQDNITFVDTLGVNYERLCELEVSRMRAEGAMTGNLRKDAVKGFEIMLTFSREMSDDIDIVEWAKESLQWADKTFNPPEHKAKFTDARTGEKKEIETNNIKHAVLHMDEGTPHMHIYVVPIDDKGHLNSHFYNKGRWALMAMQSEYAKAVERFGLERGYEHSTATPQTMSKYYSYITRAVEAELPEPKEGETIEEYKIRADETYKAALASHRNEVVKMERKINEGQSVIAGAESSFRVKGRKKVVEEITEFGRIKRGLETYPDQDWALETQKRMEELAEYQRQKDEREEKDEER